MKQFFLSLMLALAMVAPAFPNCKDCPHKGTCPKCEGCKGCGHNHGRNGCCQQQGQQGGGAGSTQQTPQPAPKK